MRRVALFALAVALVCCATIASEGQGDRDLPSSGVGPFRKLQSTEVPGTPPYVLDDPGARLREPAVLRASDDPTTTEVFLYATGTAGGADVIYRSHAIDARSFFGTSAHSGMRPLQVLAATKAWEGGGVSGPSPLRMGAEIWLYYAAKGGIGLARSNDGLSFSTSDAPVLPLEGARAPSVVVLPDRSLRMLFEKDGVIREAKSADGIAWTEMGVVLGPSSPQGDAGVRPFDTVAVGDPCIALRTTPAGRLHFRVLYTGFTRDDTGNLAPAIGFAARYGTEGPLVRNPSPVFTSAAGDSAPALFEWIDPTAKTRALSLLYDTEPQKGGGYPAVAAAVAPVDAMLPEPAGFPSSP